MTLSILFSKTTELEEELAVMGHNMKSLEISEQEVGIIHEYPCVMHLSAGHEERGELRRHDQRSQRTFEIGEPVLPSFPFTSPLIVRAKSIGSWAPSCQIRVRNRSSRRYAFVSCWRCLLGPSLSDDLLSQMEKYKGLSGELDFAFAEITNCWWTFERSLAWNSNLYRHRTISAVLRHIYSHNKSERARETSRAPFTSPRRIVIFEWFLLCLSTILTNIYPFNCFRI